MDTISQLRNHMEFLKLYRMRDALDAELAEAEKQNPGTPIVMERLFSAEVAALTERRIDRRIRESKLDERKILDDFDFRFQTGVDKSQIMSLAELGFIERKQWLVLAGGSGTGKSHIAKALLLMCCKQMYRCRYTTASDMLRTLMSGLADDSLDQKLKLYVRPQVLLIDEIGFDRLEHESPANAALFFKVIEGRYCKNSTMVTTNIDFQTMGDYLGDPVITASLVDRMVHHSIIISIDGPSWRMHESQVLNSPTGEGKK